MDVGGKFLGNASTSTLMTVAIMSSREDDARQTSLNEKTSTAELYVECDRKSCEKEF